MNKVQKRRLIKKASDYPQWILSDRQLCDLEMILDGSFSPLNGFLNEKNYSSVLKNMRLANGIIWPIPVTLDISVEFRNLISIKGFIALKDKEGFFLAIMKVESIWIPDKLLEADLVYGSSDYTHPGINYLLNKTNPVYVGGTIEKIQSPHHYDYQNIRKTPNELKKEFKKMEWDKIIAFQTRNPLHRAHVEMTLSALKNNDAKLLIHPAVGMTKPGDVNHYTRVRCYKHILNRYPINSAYLSLIPLAMRMAGPREALWHAVIRKNYGCTQIIIGRDHAGPGNDKNGNPFYGPYDAQKMIKKYEDEIGISMIPFKFMVFLEESKTYVPIDEVPDGVKYKTISGTELRECLDSGDAIPEWFTYPEVSEELRLSKPSVKKKGFTVFFTGLSGSGKSTLANGLLIKLLENGSRPTTLLDGDIVRTHLSSELGFSKEHRSINVQRIGFVASEITKNGGIAICAPIAPYEKDRKVNKNLISQVGGYIEIYVSTSLEKCEERDVKGLYALAREGKIKEFTGISDPYEAPKNPDLIIDSSGESPEDLVNKIYSKIEKLGYI